MTFFLYVCSWFKGTISPAPYVLHRVILVEINWYNQRPSGLHVVIQISLTKEAAVCMVGTRTAVSTVYDVKKWIFHLNTANICFTPGSLWHLVDGEDQMKVNSATLIPTKNRLNHSNGFTSIQADGQNLWKSWYYSDPSLQRSYQLHASCASITHDTLNQDFSQHGSSASSRKMLLTFDATRKLSRALWSIEILIALMA